MAEGVMRTSGALRHIEHLATLGLDPHIAIPEMLRTLLAAVRGADADFCWLGGNGRIEDTCHAHGAAARVGGTSQAAQFTLRIVVGGRALAMLRVTGREPLVERDRRLFRAALPMLQRAMLHGPFTDERFDDMPEQSGVLVCAADGRLISADAVALRLLAEMEARPLAGTDVVPPRPGERLPSFIVDAWSAGLRRASTRQVERVSCWGAFRAQIFVQLSSDRDPPPHVVLIAKYLPRRVALMRTLEQLDLSPRERQVAFHLGNGASAIDGAAAMGVSVTTWRTYVKRVYVRLDVRDRFDLLTRLNVRLAA